jgi:hypothetical protein
MQVRTMHGNERATQIRLLRQLFFSPLGFPAWCLAKNVIPRTAQYGATVVKNATSSSNSSIRLTKMWEDTSIVTVENLQALLMSCKLHRNPVAYASLSEGFESGHMRQTTYLEPQQLSKTLTTAAEAHFRMELYYCLSRPCYSHPKSTASYDERQNMWLEMIPKVFKDREDNEEAAWAQRVDNINAEDESEDNNMDGERGDGVEGETADVEKDYAPSFLDPKYL